MNDMENKGCEFDSIFEADIGLSDEDKIIMRDEVYDKVEVENKAFKDELTTDVNDKISNLVGGSPRVVDTTENILALQENKGIAVSTENGNWFYWNGAKYVDSGKLYQSNGVDINDSVYDVFLRKITGINLFNPSKKYYGYLEINGALTPSEAPVYYTTEYIPIKANQSITLNGQARFFLAFDRNKIAISSTYKGNLTNETFTAKQSGYVRYTILQKEIEKNRIGISYGDKVLPIEPFTYKIEENVEFNDLQEKEINDKTNDKIKKEIGLNVLNPNTLEDGIIGGAGGVIEPNVSYWTTEYIPIKKDIAITITGKARRILAFDNEKYGIPESYERNETINKTYIPTQDGYIRYTIYREDLAKNILMISYTNKPLDMYIPYEYVCESKIGLNNRQMEEVRKIGGSNASNILENKKWMACGDSFTQGDFDNSLTNNFTFLDGKYKGKLKVYPRFIGLRNKNMEVNMDLAQCGSTLAHTDSRNDAFVDRYKQIPLDVDYITIKFGINDENKNVPIGDIEDKINTTFCGAWNIVLEYLIANYPKTKIGILITNGCDRTYADASIMMAKRWGIPYLNESYSEQLGLNYRVQKKELCSEAKNIYTNRYAVNPKLNTHPNELAHEFESTFVEAFLRRL